LLQAYGGGGDVRSVLVVLVALIAVTAFACGSSEKDYAKYLFDRSYQFEQVLFGPYTENWSPSPSSLQQAYESLQEIDKNLSEVRPPTQLTRELTDRLQLLVYGLEVATREALNISPPSDSGLYYEAAVSVISTQFVHGDVLGDIANLAMELGAVTTTTGLGGVTTTGQ
jgi:hypothetical protein